MATGVNCRFLQPSILSAHKRVFLRQIKPDAKPIALIARKLYLHARPLYWT